LNTRCSTGTSPTARRPFCDRQRQGQLPDQASQQSDTAAEYSQDGLLDDFVAVVTSMAAQIYGRRSSKQRVKAIREAVEQAYGEGE